MILSLSDIAAARVSQDQTCGIIPRGSHRKRFRTKEKPHQAGLFSSILGLLITVKRIKS
jgi:hypothetical protein